MTTDIAIRSEQSRSVNTFDMRTLQHCGLALVLALWGVCVHGYHPYGEDGGVYLAGIKWLMNPALYQYDTGFVTAHVRLSVFARLVVLMVHETHWPLMVVMFLLYVGSVWLTIVAGWQLASRWSGQRREWYGSVLLLTAWLSLPVAGTSLMLADPYVSARSFSTPLSMFALVAALDAVRLKNESACTWRKPALRCGAILVATVAIHPLMGFYATLFIGFMLALSTPHRARRVIVAALSLSLIAGAFLMYRMSPLANLEYIQVAQTRSYWFLDQWHWYEWCGLLAPLAFAAVAGWLRRWDERSPIRLLAWASVCAICSCVAVDLLFVHTGAKMTAVAAAQPMRQLQLVYVLMILGLGSAFERYVVRQRLWGWLLVMLFFGVIMFDVQRSTFPSSLHLELPGRSAVNEWEQAFEWIRQSTPANAVFAIDSHYITEPGEDAENFRAIAERSVLPDYSKDGGIASITPSLAATWSQSQGMGEGFGELPDVVRKERTLRTPMTWAVLPATASTAFPCPYRNTLVEVCRLR